MQAPIPIALLLLSLLPAAATAEVLTFKQAARAIEVPLPADARALSPALVETEAFTSTFSAPDDKSPYTCTFHWFRTGDGRIAGLDLIRSDDTGKLALRAYLQGNDGALRGMNYEAPSHRWGVFVSGHRPDLDSGVNIMARGENWIAGSVSKGSPLKVAFELAVEPVSKGLGTGRLGLRFADLVATDFTNVRFKGWLEFDGERLPIDSEGITSVHYGARLPRAAYVATIPNGSHSPGILLAAAAGDNLRLAGRLLGSKSFIYAYGTNGVSPLSFGVGDFAGEIPLGGGAKVVLSGLQGFPHTLLGEPTVTGIARAVLIRPAPGIWPPSNWSRKETLNLGTVIIDYRGASYISTLP